MSWHAKRHYTQLEGVGFVCDANGKDVGCLISTEALQDGFGDPRRSIERIYEANELRIVSLAEFLYNRGDIQQDGRILITSNHVYPKLLNE